jgi:hypothetical protein
MAIIVVAKKSAQAKPIPKKSTQSSITSDFSEVEEEAFEVVKSILKNDVKPISRLSKRRNKELHYFNIRLDKKMTVCSVCRSLKNGNLTSFESRNHFCESIKSPNDILHHADKLVQALRDKAAKKYLTQEPKK